MHLLPGWPPACEVRLRLRLRGISDAFSRFFSVQGILSGDTLGYQRRALDPSKKACDTHCYCFCYNFAPKREISGDGGTLSPRFPWDFEHAQNLTVEKGASLRYGMLWYSTSPGCRSGCHLELCSTVSRPPDAGSALIEDLANAQLFTFQISE